MITPAIIQVLFWIGVVFAIPGGLLSMANGDIVPGLLTLLLGPIGVRVCCELLILLFRMNDGVQAMARQQGGEVGSGPTA
jgi:hypothetical protein